MNSFLQDLQYALRLVRRNAGVSALCVLVLALGIGANTAIFSVVNKVLLEPLPYPDPDRLVQLMVHSPMGHATLSSVPKFVVWRERRRAFSAVAAFTSAEPVILSGPEQPVATMRIRISAEYFHVFGPALLLGRAFSAAEDVPGAPHVALISPNLWKRRFGGQRSVIGTALTLENTTYEIIGVMESETTLDAGADLWVPLQADPNSTDQSSRLHVVARMRPGIQPDQARRQMYAAAGEFHRRFPRAMGPLESFTVMPLRDVLVGNARPSLFLLLGAVGFVLLIACANVTNLLLAQGSQREREIAVRASLGARPRRIIAQVLTESALLAIAGGMAGVAIGYVGVQALAAANPGHVPLLGAGDTISLDWRVQLFTLVVACATCVLIGLYPALHATRLDLTATLRSTGTQGASGVRHSRVRAALVVAQMACAMVLLIGSGMLIRTFVAMQSVDPGFTSRNVLTLEMPIAGDRFAKTQEVARLVETAEQRIDALPDVEAVAAAGSLPLEPSTLLPFIIDRRALMRSSYHGVANWRSVSPRYFEVFRIALLRGRLFTDHDNAAAAPVAIVNNGFARKFWPGIDTTWERITVGNGVRPEISEPSRIIVGVVADVRDGGLNRDPEPIVYVPIAQVTDGMNAFINQVRPLQWVVRTAGQPVRLRASIERELGASSGGTPIGRARLMDEVVAQSRARSSFNAMLLTIFAAVAMLLAASGLYAVTAYSVQQRTREIGIRMALGAAPQRVGGMILAQGLRLTLIGIAVGSAAALGLTQYLVSAVYGVETWDPLVLALVGGILTLVAIAATLVPARWVTRVPLTEALKDA